MIEAPPLVIAYPNYSLPDLNSWDAIWSEPSLSLPLPCFVRQARNNLRDSSFLNIKYIYVFTKIRAIGSAKYGSPRTGENSILYSLRAIGSVHITDQSAASQQFDFAH